MSQERERDEAPAVVDGGDAAGDDADATDADATDADSGGGRPAVVDRDAVAGTFVDAAPRTLREVVAETGLERERAVDALDALVADGDLAEKTLASESASVHAWYLPATAHVERLASGSPDADRTDAVADAIAELDVPGVSEMMQDWRRDAIRSAWEYLVEQGAATDAAIVDAVYPGHSAGYDDRENWWECVRPRLRTLPGVDAPVDGGDGVWTYAPA
ncbi:hypothetical protein G9C85_08835 [Halorubellus sp. JP-L1]|uniref:hypothetical protein n=1 Tax=Halorubellus sp. JP-L1 TaxID=2715753 RepID=UPI001407E597|nr:hypothetical protein [Halorubellus sp. JP-L1]NHN41735.1 hypothetical protein [Halorubellus sp. JP-L1]